MINLARLRAFARRKLDAESRFLFRNSSWFFLTNANAAVCDFLRSLILARGLGAESFGIFVLVTTLVRAILEFFNLNVGTALVKFGAEYTAAGQPGRLAALLKACYTLAAITAAASVLFVVVTSFLVYDTFIPQPGFRGYMQLYAIAASLSFFDYVSISLLNLHFRFRLNALIKICLDVAELSILAVTLWLLPGDLGALLIAAGGALALKAVAYNAGALWEMRATVRPQWQAPLSALSSDRGRIGSFVINNSLSRTVHTMIFSGDVLLLGALSGAREVGYYTIAKKLAFAVLRLTDPMASSIFPQLAKLTAQKDFAGVRLMLGKVTTVLGALVILLFALAVPFGEQLMVLVYGQDFQPAAKALLLLVAAAGIGASFFWSPSLIISLGRVDARLRAYLAALGVSGAVAWWLVPGYGATGLGAAMLCAVLVMQGVFVAVCYRELGRQAAQPR